MAAESYIDLGVVVASGRSSEKVIHHIFLRRNVPKFPLEDDQRTIFVSNLPVDSTDANLKDLFSKLGGRTELIKLHTVQDSTRHIAPEDMDMDLDEIQDEVFSKEVKRLKRLSALPQTWTRGLLPSGCNAHVTFVESVEMKAVLKAARDSKVLLYWNDNAAAQKSSPIGISRYQEHLTAMYPSTSALQDSVDAYMELYNKEEILKKRKQKLVRSVPDDEGFVTITRGGRSGAGRAADALKLAEKAKTRGIVSDLYRFQRRDEHKAKMADLRMKFEDDKRKIAELKARRRFMG